MTVEIENDIFAAIAVVAVRYGVTAEQVYSYPADDEGATAFTIGFGTVKFDAKWNSRQRRVKIVVLVGVKIVAKYDVEPAIRHGAASIISAIYYNHS